MEVEMSLAEMLINAIAGGLVPGVQFKRGWSSDKATFDGLNKVIASRLDSARRIAISDAMRAATEVAGVMKMQRALRWYASRSACDCGCCRQIHVDAGSVARSTLGETRDEAAERLRGWEP